MTNREKVLKGLECLSDENNICSKDTCPYYMFESCVPEITHDALELLKKQSQWISVEDGLPEEEINPLTMDFKEVLCFCDFGGIPRRTDVRTYKFGKRCVMEEGHFWHEGTPMDEVVTHWMPLPEPPEEVMQNDIQ